LLLFLWLLLFLFVLLIEHEVERRKYGTIRTVTVEHGAHGGVVSE
jgi:hypothetical protein